MVLTNCLQLGLICVFFLSLIGVVSSSYIGYKLNETWQGYDFFNHFNFYNGFDPANGYVWYVSKTQALSLNLISNTSTTVTIKVEDQTIAQWPGRKSVRIESKQSYKYVLS